MKEPNAIKIGGVTFLVAVLAVAASAAIAANASHLAGPGMMGESAGYGPGMMGGAFGGIAGGGTGSTGTTKPTAAELTTVRNRINAWLASNQLKGFTVAEVMAFTNNDYVAVHGPNGKPAFELLTDLNTNWVMEEPPSMMWNTRYGMMGDLGRRISPMMGGWMMGGGWNAWYGEGSGKVTTTPEAVQVANAWLAQAGPGEQVASDAGRGAMGKFPGYYTFDTTRGRRTVGMLSVNAATGAVWYHAWHGRFLSEREF